MTFAQQPIFVTGTDTNVGKTFISAWLCRHMQADYWKPIQTGERDANVVRELAPHSHIYPEEYYFEDALSPHLAARNKNQKIDVKSIKIPSTERPLIIEGAGGVLVPLNDSMLIIDLIKYLNVPVLIVSRDILGTINHTCLTVEALKKRGIPILGIILNQSSRNSSNKEAIEHYSQVSVLAAIPSTKEENIKQLLLELVPPILLKETLTNAFNTKTRT